MVSPATKKADLGGIDTPPSANYLVVHNPAKCSVFWRSTQGHGEISFPFGNHPPTPPILTSFATATSQLAGFRNFNRVNMKISGLFHHCRGSQPQKIQQPPWTPTPVARTSPLAGHAAHSGARSSGRNSFQGPTRRLYVQSGAPPQWCLLVYKPH